MQRTVFILLAFLLFCNMMLQAEPVSESRAREIAKKVLAAQPATKASSSDVKLIWNGENAATKAAGDPAFYVYGGDRGGFVIIAGDDNVPPVLAISETNQFKVEGMPENVKWWMDRMKYYVRNAAPDPEAKEKWAMFAETKSGPLPGEVTVIRERLTPEWDQGNNDPYLFGRQVYNAKCPVDKNRPDTLSMVGCGAVALAEIVTTQSGSVEIPAPVGTIGNYSVYSDVYTKPAERVLDGTVYDWARLRTLTDITAVKAVVDSNTTAGNALLDNLAQLLADMGSILESLYSYNGTSVNSAKVIPGIGNHMGFNKAARLLGANDYSPNQWVQMLKSEIDLRPIFYYGTSNRGGHAFVFDGYGTYSGQDVFHVNFGWSGWCNGYYYYYNLDTGDDEIYNKNCGAFFDLYPAPSSVYPKVLGVNIRDGEYMHYFPGGQPLKNGDPVLISYFWIDNIGYTAYDGKTRLVAVDKTGAVKQVLKENNSDHYDSYKRIWYPEADGLSIDYDFAFGDKIIFQYTTDADNTVWAKAESILSKDALTDEIPLMPAAFIKTNPLGYHVGDYFCFELMNHLYLYTGTVWKITEPDGTQNINLPQSSQYFQLTQTGTYKIEAAVAPTVGGDIIETITTSITVSE